MPTTGSEAESDRQSPRDIADLVRSIATVMQHADVSELDLDVGNLKLRLRRAARSTNGASETFPRFDSTPELVPPDGHLITAPMIGTFYTAPSPGTPPFVIVGDEVQTGQPVGIIEAMKIMNEITADRSGVVEAILVENGQAVEYGTPLFRLAVGLTSHA